ncbi:MAG: hypothetical protein NTX20_00555 [Verrucomicrobia bacterium]|nr:hypothetical protein [Verrucomicrobiota bacterium]
MKPLLHSLWPTGQRVNWSTFLLCLLALPLSAADDTTWLQTKGTLIFHDAFEREETGTGLKDIGNGWESATADRVPKLKQADLDAGIMKIASATKEAGHAAHIHHDAGFTDGGVIVRFRFPGLNKAENLQLGFVDRELKDVHAGHLCYAIISQTDLTLTDRKTGSMNLAVKKKHADDAAAKKKPDPEFEAMLKTKTQVTPFKADTEWHVLTLVTEGDEMRFTLDGKPLAAHHSAGYAHDNKRWFSFLANSTVWVDDVKIYKVK